MKFHPLFAVLAGLVFFTLNAPAAIYYVAQNNPSPTPPYASWDTAATNIQDAINVATNGDEILVTNGVYAYGGLAMAGDTPDRVALNIPVTVQSINGPWVTIIQGGGATNGPGAMRCAWVTNGAVLDGFTLQAGGTLNSGATLSQCGGGVFCVSSNALVSNCVIISNTAAYQGGGAYQGTINNCWLFKNSAVGYIGGGSAYSVMNSCTVISNSSYGVYTATCTNCIIYSNSPADHINGTLAYCCTTSPPGGPGNISTAPQLFADDVHLMTGSPCIGAGINKVSGTDIFGNAWANPPSMGCTEWKPTPLVSQPRIQLAGNPIGFTVGNMALAGQSPLSFSWLQNGAPLSNNGHFSATQTTNLIATGVSLADAGNYQLVVSNTFGTVTSQVATLVFHCVSAAGTNPAAPYLTWATAATNIQDAITAASPGDVVLVTNGVYAHGGISMDGVIVNCVSVNKGVLVESVNGPATTIIQGAWDPVSTNGTGAVRCAWLTNSAILSGFTLQGGATRGYISPPNQSMEGGGIYCISSNAVVYNCVLATNFAAYYGGGVFQNTLTGNAGSRTTLIHCTLTGNDATGLRIFSEGSINGAGSGGGAYGCNLNNCLITSNRTEQSTGGGAQNCSATNCAFTQNQAANEGAAAESGYLVNCTVTGNISDASPAMSAVYGATLINSIVMGNSPEATSYNPSAGNFNYGSCTLTYCCSDPLPSGTGNIDVNPQFLGDGIHLAQTSPCIGAGTASVTYGTDIDGQPWNNPPAIGCDEWQPAPVIGTQPAVQIGSPAHGLTVGMVAAGASPNYYWSLNGAPLQDNGHYGNSGTANLVANNFGPGDAGLYQVVVSNAFGVVTSQVAQLVIHVVNAAGMNPAAPYSTWATAATNIQDAINAASAGDVVLVTNGVYAYGGLAMVGNLTNRVALTTPITVISANGWAATAIQGAWDPISTNGPGAVRCAYVADGAVLNGFTLQNGATRATGDTYPGGPLESGGGVWCSSINGVVADCVISNNCAVSGGGFANGTLNNSLVLFNQTFGYGAGAFDALLNNCTVVNNYNNANQTQPIFGAGTYNGIIRNSIVIGNYDNVPPLGSPSVLDNYGETSEGAGIFYYSCTSPTLLSGPGNTNVNPQFLDWFHITTTSPCRGAGSALFASGTDLDGEAWANPPSIGCDEVIVTNLVGPLSASFTTNQTYVLVNHPDGFTGNITGRASGMVWSFGDGQALTNYALGVIHEWTNAGNYTVTFTAFNNDNPAGVSASAVINVQPENAPQLQSAVPLTNGFQFQFTGQPTANYTIQYATNLTSPVVWNTLQNIYYSSGGVTQITDGTAPTGTRFYRVLAQ